MADPKKAVFRIVIDGTMEAVFRELTKTGEPQGAVFNAVLTLDEPGLVRGRKWPWPIPESPPPHA